MKIWLGLTFIVGLLTCCGQDHNDGSAIANPTFDCLHERGGYCESYPYYGQYELSAYPYDHQIRYDNGFCCGQNRIPIYHPNQYGLMCLNRNWGYNNYQTWTYEYNYPNPLGAGCTNQLGRACNPSNPRSCHKGFCQPTALGSDIGICIQY